MMVGSTRRHRSTEGLLRLRAHYDRHCKYRGPSAIAILALSLQPSDGLGFSLCLFKNLFALDCPACGLGRSISALLHFRVADSFFYHPLGFAVLTVLIFCLCTNRLTVIPNAGLVLKSKWNRLFIRSFVIIFILFFWLVRLVSQAL